MKHTSDFIGADVAIGYQRKKSTVIHGVGKRETVGKNLCGCIYTTVFISNNTELCLLCVWCVCVCVCVCLQHLWCMKQ